jgi:penicillin-binding protein 1C
MARRYLKTALFLALALLLMETRQVAAGPSFEDVKRRFKSSDLLILDRMGEPIHQLRMDNKVRRLEWKEICDIPPFLLRALVHSEDKRFYGHAGVDYLALAGALLRGVTGRGFRGGSTITMQLSSMLDEGLTPATKRRSLLQKWRQMRAAAGIEKEWTKDQILEAYLNLAGFRGEIQGIDAASRVLFGKDPSGLDYNESAVLVVLLRAPNAPLEAVKKRALSLVSALGMETSYEEMERVLESFSMAAGSSGAKAFLAPHFARLLEELYYGQDRISSSMDAQIQRFTLERLKHHLSVLKKRNVNEGAAIIVDNKTGGILSYVSLSERFPHVDGVRSKRQAGSSLKPFLYAMAFEEKIITPASLINDSPIRISLPNGIYSPKNYDDRYRGKISARTALASSLNTAAVRVLSLVGVDSLLDKLKCLGINTLEDSGGFYGLSLALGSADVTLYQLVEAYMALANRGMRKRLSPLPVADGEGHRVFSEEAAFLVSDILSDREARSATFGLENSLSTRFWSAVKTGTSKDMKDNWCIGYTSQYTVGVWFGNFSGEPMWDVSGVTGAAQVWLEIVNLLHSKQNSAAPSPPDGIVCAYVSTQDGNRREWFIKGTEPAVKILVPDMPLQRITYPSDGSILVLDPNIPDDVQRVAFSADPASRNHYWSLNGEGIGSAHEMTLWAPQGGRHLLELKDGSGNVLDSVRFEVRGYNTRDFENKIK